MTELKFKTIINPSEQQVAPIHYGLDQFDIAYLGKEIVEDHQNVAVIAGDETGTVIGGIHGEIFYNWLHVHTFWVDETWRGQKIGTRLLFQIEEVALVKECHGSHLETIGFQALEFYLKNGYEVFGQLNNKPKGNIWYYLKKEW